MTKLSILLPDGESGLALKVLRCLSAAPEFETSILSADPKAPIRFSRYCKHFLTHQHNGFDEARLEKILEAAHAVRADVIMPVDLKTIQLIAAYRNHVATVAALPPTPDAQLLNEVSDKWAFSEILRREGSPHPRTVLYRGGRSNLSVLSHVQYPALAKPRNLSNGRGIRLCQSAEEIEEYIQSFTEDPQFCVQEFIAGNDLDCSVLALDGEILAHTIQRGIQAAKQPFMPPAVIEFVHDTETFDIIESLIRTLRWSGVANFDLRVDPDGRNPKIIEMNARYWTSVLGSLVAGVNFPYLACLSALGVPFEKPQFHHTRYARPEVSATLLMKRVFAHDGTIRGLGETGLPFSLRDPLPDLAKHIAKIPQKLSTIFH